MHFSKQKNMNAFVNIFNVNIFNVNFDFQGWNISQRYWHILIALTQACEVEKKTSLLYKISCLHIKKKLQFGKTELKRVSLKCFKYEKAA